MGRRVMVSANLTPKVVAERGEVLESEVEVAVECAGCGATQRAWATTRRQAFKRLAEVVKGWGMVFDREVNDGEYPYCPACIKSVFPNLQARLRAEVLGKPMPARRPKEPRT